MKNLLAIAIILVSFVATTALVGCAPSSNDKKERVRKGRGLNQKPGTAGAKPAPGATPAKPGAPSAPAPGPAAAPGAGAPSPLTNLAGANEAANKQIDEVIASAFGPNIPKKTLKDIPEGTYRLSQVIATVVQSNNSYRAILAAKVKTTGNQIGIEKESFLSNNRSHGGSSPLTNAATLALEIVKEGETGIKVNQPIFFEMNIPSGDVGEVLSHDTPPSTAVQPLSLLDSTLLDVSGEFFTTTRDGATKGTKLHLRASNANEIRMLIERPTQGGVFRSFILIFNKAETAPVPPT